jgi:hypothetical protein
MSWWAWEAQMQRHFVGHVALATLSSVRRPSQATALARARYERLLPFRLRLGPVTVSLICLVVVGLLALAYLGQVASVSRANQRLQALQAQQDLLRREDEAAHARLGAAQNPEFIRKRAGELGLVPAPPENVQVIVLPTSTPTPTAAATAAATPGGRP